MLLHNKKVAIIGAGPVGLTMAKLLQQKGVDVNIYERDKDAQTRIWGGTLDLHKGTGQEAIQKAGLLQDYYDMAIPMGITMTNQHGKVLSLKPPQYENPEINRNHFRELLLHSLSSNTVIWNRKLSAILQKDGKWHLQFENKEIATADVVIIANGGMSKARKHVVDADPEETGTFIIQGDVINPELNCPEFYQLCNGNRLMTANQGNLLVANPDNNGVLTYGFIFKKPEEWEKKQDLDFQNIESIITFLSQRITGWGECFFQVIRATSFFVGLPTRKISLENQWKSNRTLPITLIGDAAHLMPPFAGHGVNIGLKDTVILSENLTNEKFKTIGDAIQDYEEKMYVYAIKAQLESSNNEIEMRQPNFSFEKFFN